MIVTLEERRQAKAEAIERLRAMLKPPITLNVRQVSSSAGGDYKVFSVWPEGPSVLPRLISEDVAWASGYRYDMKRAGIGIGGSDAPVKELIERLSTVLFGDPKTIQYREY